MDTLLSLLITPYAILVVIGSKSDTELCYHRYCTPVCMICLGLVDVMDAAASTAVRRCDCCHTASPCRLCVGPQNYPPSHRYTN